MFDLNNMCSLKVKAMHKDFVIPEAKTVLSAGFDVSAYVDEPVVIAPHETKMIPLGFATAFPAGYVAFLFARSGLATKSGIAPANKVGVIDADYRGEWMLAAHNHSDTPVTINPRDRVGQFIVIKTPDTVITMVDELDSTERGSGAFGSTGT